MPAEDAFIGWIRLFVPVPWQLTVRYTHNLRTVLSYRRTHNEVALRLHHGFGQMGPHVAQAIALYLQGKPGHKPVLKQAISALAPQKLPTRPKSPAARKTVGKVHALAPLFDRLNMEQFAGRCTSQVTWGRSARPGNRRRSIILGSFCPSRQLIRIHPALDQDFVPEFVVLGVLHHEMLHELLGVTVQNGRRRVHTPEFVAIERGYGDYERCCRWERANLNRLLAYRP